MSGYIAKRRLEIIQSNAPVMRSVLPLNDDINALFVLARRYDGRFQSPREFMETAIGLSPDSAQITKRVPRSELPAPETFISPFELYFLGQLNHWKTVREVNVHPGKFRVIDSVKCLRERIRTRKFLLGLKEAVEKLEANGKDPITLCDAGCGAIPIIAIYAALCSKKITALAIETNPDSVRIAREIVHRIGLGDRILVVHADAAKCAIEGKIDLLVSETMDTCLTSEPLVDILFNLSKYLSSNAITLPSRVILKAGIVSLYDYAVAPTWISCQLGSISTT